MRAVLGIGNIGSRYDKTRHNVGFMFLDRLAEKYNLEFIPSKGDYFYCLGKLNGSDFALIRPTAYVNNSGGAAIHFLNENNISPEDLLVVHDDINLNFGSFKTKLNGGDGGHNGIASIIYSLNSDQFPRVRIGIGNSFDKGKMVDYVLERFTGKEIETLEEVFLKSVILTEAFITGGSKGMLDVNSIMKTEERKAEEQKDK